MSHQVQALRLHVRSHGTPAPDLDARSRRFAEQLLDEVARRLDERVGGRLVLIRRLPIKLRANVAMLADAREVARLAEAIADSIDIQATSSPREDADVAVFDSDSDWRASYLAHHAGHGPPRWYFATLAAADDRCAALTTLDRVTVATILRHVHAHDRLTQLLDQLDLATTLALATTLEIADLDRRNVAAEGDASHEPQRRASAVRDAIVRAVAASAVDTPATTPDASPSTTIEPVMHEAAAPSATSHLTRHAGLVYLVRCLLELDAGEILWRACVPEQVVLTVALASLIPNPEDPAPSLLGGAALGTTFEASAEQRAEIVSALCASLHGSLPRRGLASLPEVELAFGGDGHHRVLYALADSQPIFAAPAPTIAAAQRALAAFLEAWPTGAVAGPPVICELVASSRVSLRDRVATVSARIGGDDAALIAAVVAGTATCLFQSRVGDRELAGTGHITDTDDVRTVSMAMEAIRLPVRRAGLDIDPGWVPWLSRSVRIVFTD